MAKTKYVTSSDRKVIARPQPPMGDRRTKRNRTRSSQKSKAIKESY